MIRAHTHTSIYVLNLTIIIIIRGGHLNGKCLEDTVRQEKLSTHIIGHAGEHISLSPVSKVDGILAKIFIYNILQQRLDRLLLAVLGRKRGRSVHEWDRRLGLRECRGGVQGGGGAGGGFEDQAKTNKQKKPEEHIEMRQSDETLPSAGSEKASKCDTSQENLTTMTCPSPKRRELQIRASFV